MQTDTQMFFTKSSAIEGQDETDFSLKVPDMQEKESESHK